MCLIAGIIGYAGCIILVLTGIVGIGYYGLLIRPLNLQNIAVCGAFIVSGSLVFSRISNFFNKSNNNLKKLMGW